MKICYIFSNFHLSSITGQPAIIYRLAQAAKEQGNQVYIISNSADDREVFKEGINYFMLRGEGVFKTYFSNALRIIGYLRRVDPDIIHVHGYLLSVFISFLSIFFRARRIYSVCETLEILDPLYRRISCLFLNSSYMNIVSSEFIKNELVKRGIEEKRITVARIGLDENFLQETQDIAPVDTDIFFYGDSRTDRGFDVIFRLAKAMPELKFRVLLRWQTKECQSYLEEMKRLSNAEVLFYPYTQDLKAYILKSRLIVLPYRWMAVRPPLTLIEPMALGACVITSGMPGNNEIIRDGQNGIIVNFDDLDAVMSKIKLLLQDEAQRSRIGERAAVDIRLLYSAGESAKIFGIYALPEKSYG
ncbi:MAG: glycosyltransferase family 4 protein [Candidatus Omnitrophica bacterium]|nr:glycosyltransferase family 4 protein [Candidatus Omnitrophota bacterium]